MSEGFPFPDNQSPNPDRDDKSTSMSFAEIKRSAGQSKSFSQNQTPAMGDKPVKEPSESLPKEPLLQRPHGSASAAPKMTVTGANTTSTQRPPSHTPAPKNKVKKREGGKSDKKKDEGGLGDNTMLHSLIRAVIYIVCVLVVSGVCAWVFIEAANDVYAFSKDDTVIKVEVGADMTRGEVAELLHENNLIKYPFLFKLYCQFKHVDLKTVAGEYEVSGMLNYKEFVQTFNDAKSATRVQVVITIPEGYNVDQIIEYLVNEKGIGTREGYIDAINNYDFDKEEFRFLKELPESTDRRYRLEGYLFPDTYYVYEDASEETVIYRFLQNTQKKLTDEYYAKAADVGMTMDQVVTLASMIQAEAKYVSEYENVSSVFHNRLNDPGDYPRMESDATVRYALSKPTGDLTAADLGFDNKYNTYLYDGLPPGAICNPSLDAITYAMYPANTDYHYFVAGKDGHSIFSRTNAEHEQAKATVRAQQ